MTKKISDIGNKTRDRIKDYFKKIIEIIKQPEMGVLPGQIAFSVILSIVPIITLLVYASSLFGINIDTIINYLNQIIPGGANWFVPYLSGNSIDMRLALIFIWMFYLASNGCNSVILISNQIYGINQSTWLKRRFKAIFMTVSIIIVLLFIFVVPTYGSKVIELLPFVKNTEVFHTILHYLKWPIIVLLMFLFLRMFYETAPDRVRKHTHINTGTLFTTFGWIIITAVYNLLSKNITNYNLFYGALGSVAFLMIWLYFMAFIFVIGLCLNYGEEVDKETMEKTGAIKIIKNK